MTTPEDIAKVLVLHHMNSQNTNEPVVDLVLEETDNEYRTEVLLSIYAEAYRILKGSTESGKIASTLRKIFKSLGYKIILRVAPQNLIYYARLANSNKLYRNPFHPFCIREMILNNELKPPESFDKLFYESCNMKKVINVQESVDQNQRIFRNTVEFQRL